MFILDKGAKHRLLGKKCNELLPKFLLLEVLAEEAIKFLFMERESRVTMT